MQSNRTIEFSPSKDSWYKQLNGVEAFYANWYPEGVLYFEGLIDIEKFIDSLDITLQKFDWVFARIFISKKPFYVSYNVINQYGGVELEIENVDGEIDEISTKSLIPSHIQNLLNKQQKDGLPTASFKITYSKASFTIGYSFSHIFFDQASIVSFFRYFSHIYSDGLSSVNPILFDHELYLSSVPESNIDDVRSYANEMGLVYVANPHDVYKQTEWWGQHVAITILVNSQELVKIKEQSSDFISQNDLLQAIYFKIIAMSPNVNSNDHLQFGFACDMRKRAAIAPDVIGNIGLFCVMPKIEVEKIRRSGFAELALFNRQFLNTITIDKYNNELWWFKRVTERTFAGCFLPNSHVFPLSWGQTNWGSFLYDDISFDGAVPYALKTTPFPPEIKFNMIHFERVNNKWDCCWMNCFLAS